AEDNAAARALYAAAGFATVGRRPGYYKRPDGRVAALVLRRSF
ncbi:MAG TPA: alanine acetyltransferase, partial [Azospirillum sp.]